MHEKNKSIIFVVYFFIALFCVIFAVISFRFVKLWNTAVVDGVHQFVLGTRGHDPAEVLIFRPDTQQVDTLLFKGESDAMHLFSSAGFFVDGVAPYDNSLDQGDSRIEGYLRRQIFHIQNTSLNVIDFFRLWLFQKNMKQNVGKKMVFMLPLSQSASTGLAQTLADKTLYQEGKTIAIVNASTLYGEGGSMATALIAMGANVISVTTADNRENTSYINFSGRSTYTLAKLSRITHIPLKISQDSSRLADITIVLGQDIKTKLQ